jgi:DNA-binding NtrC family response regulator
MASDGEGAARSVLLASPDAAWRQRLRLSLAAMRWQVREARGGAEAMAQMEEQRPEVLLVDHWLPDLEVAEFTRQIAGMYPGVDLLRVDGESVAGGMRSPRRNELLHAIREALDGGAETARQPVSMTMTDSAAWMQAPVAPPGRGARTEALLMEEIPEAARYREAPRAVAQTAQPPIPGLVGTSEPMLELARLIRLVAKREASVLIEGETGTGKEVVAKAIHQMGSRASKPLVVLNCAAIPEALLEAELFGHTRGAFTGAVQSRTGRIEAAHGGTLFLDEIGEMPLALQSKMLRFLDCGELQRVGDNEVVHVDVRVIAATHQHLEKKSEDGLFRLDLYHRLAVFPLLVPALRERKGDLQALAEHFLALMGKDAPRKRLSEGALEKLWQSSWPGNVRELAHVLERGAILADEEPEIGVEHIRLRARAR